MGRRSGTLVVAAVAAIVPPPAAAKPCWTAVIDEWSAGRIEAAHPISCYQQALQHLPDDVRTYSSAEDDIKRAMLAAIRARPRSPASVTRPSRRSLEARTAKPIRTAAARRAPAEDAASSHWPLVIKGALAILLAAAAVLHKRWSQSASIRKTG